MTDPEDDIRERYIAIGRQFPPTVAWLAVRLRTLIRFIKRVRRE